MPEATDRAERMGNHGRNNGNYIRQTAIHKISREERRMTDWICKEVHTDSGGYFEPVAELTRCKDCHWHYGTLCRKTNTTHWNDDDFCSHAESEDNG